MRPHRSLLVGVAFLSFAAACAPQDELDFSGRLAPVPFEDGKEDGPGVGAVRVDADVSDTSVWKVRHMWEETDENAESRAAGLAWGESSHLNWDQKFAAWVESLQKAAFIDAAQRVTYRIVTPEGKVIASPSLECAETAMFLRTVFAAWYGLPFFMEARDGSTRVFFGHFGIRTADGRWRSSPAFAKYADYTGKWQDGQAWPQDAQLRKLKLGGNAQDASPDDQPMIAPGAHTGAYLDELFLNKRAGYLALYILDYFYSGSLADTANTYNLRPDAIRAGDVLIRRWQRQGIGHVLQVKSVRPSSEGKPMAELIYGGMPRHQGEWGDEVEGKSALTMEDGGGAGQTDDKPPIPFWRLGGGLKRWRVARNVNGQWTNTYMPNDKALWIDSNDGARLTVRPKQLETILGEVPAAEKRDSLVATIVKARQALAEHPSSCDSRSERDEAFKKLYALADKLGTTKEELQRRYAKREDYIFKPLYYSTSKTCCWDTSSSGMYRVIVDYDAEQLAAAQACFEPVVFRAEEEVPAGYTGVVDGYQRWRDWAAKKGRTDWVDASGNPAKWSEDEECNQRGTKEDDVINVSPLIEFCPPKDPPPSPDPSSPPSPDPASGT